MASFEDKCNILSCWRNTRLRNPALARFALPIAGVRAGGRWSKRCWCCTKAMPGASCWKSHPNGLFAVLSPAFKSCEGGFALQSAAEKGCSFLLPDKNCELHATPFLPLECAFCHHERVGQGRLCHADLEGTGIPLTGNCSSNAGAVRWAGGMCWTVWTGLAKKMNTGCFNGNGGNYG